MQDHGTIPLKFQERIIFIVGCMLSQTIHKNESTIKAFLEMHFWKFLLDDVPQLNEKEKGFKKEKTNLFIRKTSKQCTEPQSAHDMGSRTPALCKNISRWDQRLLRGILSRRKWVPTAKWMIKRLGILNNTVKKCASVCLQYIPSILS